MRKVTTLDSDVVDTPHRLRATTVSTFLDLAEDAGLAAHMDRSWFFESPEPMRGLDQEHDAWCATPQVGKGDEEGRAAIARVRTSMAGRSLMPGARGGTTGGGGAGGGTGGRPTAVYVRGEVYDMITRAQSEVDKLRDTLVAASPHLRCVIGSAPGRPLRPGWGSPCMHGRGFFFKLHCNLPMECPLQTC